MIGYELIRSRRKTLSLQVTRDGRVVVRAPLGTDEGRVRAFVAKHEGWIGVRLARAAAVPRLSLASGETLLLFGKNYTVADGRTRLEGGTVFLPREGREGAFVRLVKKLALCEMRELTERTARRYGLRYAGVRISSARGRWGSCNAKGGISYTFRVAFLPLPLTEYVVAHELAHTVVFDHSPAFWRVVEGMIPDWRSRRKELKACRAMDLF